MNQIVLFLLLVALRPIEANLIKTVNDVFDQHYDNKYNQSSVVIVTEDQHDTDLFRHVHNSGRSKIISLNLYSCRFSSIFQSNVISLVGHINMMFVFMDNPLESIDRTFDCFKNTTTRRIPTKIVLVVPEMDTKRVKDVFRVFWDRRILNVVVITEIGNVTRIVGYNPYFGEYSQELTMKNMFYDRLKDLNGYELTVFHPMSEYTGSTKRYTVGNQTIFRGRDAMMMKTFIRWLNATYQLLDLDQIYGDDNPWRLANKDRKDYLKQPAIDKYKPDLFFNALNLVLNNFTEFVHPHQKNDVIVIVPKAGFKTTYEVLFDIFEKGFFLIIIFFLVVFPIVWVVLVVLEGLIKREYERIWGAIIPIFLNNFRTCLGFSFNLPRVNFIYNFILFWALICYLVVNNYFQSSLTSILTVSVRKPEIDTVRDLALSDVTPIGPIDAMNQVLNDLKKSGSEFIPKFIPMPPRFYLLSLKTVQRNFSFLADRGRTAGVLCVCPLFHVMEEIFIPNYDCYHTVRGSPYFEPLERYVLRAMQAGLYEFWHGENLHFLRLSIGLCNIYLDELKTQKAEKILQFENLDVAFYLLIFGHIIAFLVFLMELCIWFGNRRLRKL